MKECDGCGSKTECKKYERQGHGREKGEFKNLCEICANTYLGTYIDFPERHSYEVKTMAMIAYVGNLILKELKSNGRTIAR